MSNVTINNLPTASTIDGSLDLLPIYTASSGATQSISRNTYLGLSSAPVGLTDSQTLTNKILTAPTISSPVLSGTISGTYTIGGTPTFPSSVATLTGSQTLTNKTLTSPTINSPTITNATISADALTGFSNSTTGTVYGMSVASGVLASAALNNTVNTAALQSSSVTTIKIAPNAIDYTKVATGFCVQQVSFVTGTVATGTTTIPSDNTKPQSSEGDQYMSLAITPKATTNILQIQIIAMIATATINNSIMALFQDTGVNALAAAKTRSPAASAMVSVALNHTMVAGTTSSTTFKVRIGPQSADTLTFNGEAGSQLFGGITLSSIIITEYTA